MKPMLIALALLAGTFTKTFAATTPAVEPTVLKSFQETFSSATEVAWRSTNELYEAVFFMNGQYLTAYYKADGSMQALTRHITANALPVLLQNSLKKTTKNQWVSDVFEVTTDGGVQYYATLEDADTTVVLKSSANSWSTFQKQRKD